MSREKLYPLTPQQIETAIAVLVETGRHLDGKRAAAPKPRYFMNFRFVGCVDEDGRPVESIAGRETKFFLRCVVHGTEFQSTTRRLFNTSKQLTGTTCQFCEREAGVGVNFVTLRELAQQMAEDGEFDWVLDYDALPPAMQAADPILRADEFLPLLCKRAKWNSTELCGAKIEHCVNNIRTTLRGRARHIVCQGECDSKSKGKSSRLSVEELEHRLATVRNGEWVVSAPSDYRKFSDEQWFTHSACGNQVKRVPWQVMGYRETAGERGDCPYCARDSVLGCVGDSIPHFARWVDHVTEGRVSYVAAAFPKSSSEVLNFLCTCGNAFRQTLGNLIRSEHNGCKECANVSSNAQRAWILSEGTAMVERRGFCLLGDPAAYTKAAEIVTAEGAASPFATILELVQALPVHSDGIGAREASRTLDGSASLGDKRKYPVIDAAFETLTREACYWAGLLAADATISDDGEVVLELKAGDELVVQGLARFVGFPGTCHYRTVKNVDGRGIYCSLRFRSAQICSDLRRHFGIGPRKSRTLPRPNISSFDLAKAYMAGLLEGDGHVRRNRRGLIVHFVSAAEDCFEWFLELANRITGTNARARSISGARGRILNVIYHDAAAATLLRSLYDAFPGYMARKWQL